MSDMLKYNRRNLIFIVLLFVGVTVFYLVRGGGGTAAFRLDGDNFILTGPEDYSVTINMYEIRSVEVRESIDRGTCLDGGESGACSYGTWENAEFGKYQLCVLTRVADCIILVQSDGSVTVCNFENADTTREFGKTFAEYLADNGYM